VGVAIAELVDKSLAWVTAVAAAADEAAEGAPVPEPDSSEYESAFVAFIEECENALVW
jgi:hypothetical protein